MAKYLVIVESPAKVKTIKKFLGANYDVEASNGHVRDFPKSQFGIDVEHDFEPKYITIRGKGELLAKLRKAAKKADKIYLATDPDREGEAISWQLMQALKEDPKKIHRITFNEITKTAVKSSIKQARDLDMDLVDAQQKVTNTTSAMMTYCGFNSHSVSWDVFFIFSCSSKLPSSVLSNIFIITFADRQRNQILLKFLLITGFCKKGHRCSCADAPKYQSAVLPSVIIDQTAL